MRSLNIKTIVQVLILFSGFNTLLLLARLLYSNSYTYFFMIWNLFLAFIPLVISVLIYELYRLKVYSLFLILLTIVWLLFLPNAPYIITDLIHLRIINSVPLWFDSLLVISFAFEGLMLGFISLNLMQNIVKHRLGGKLSWVFVVVVSFITSFGIYLGRFLRWNSWDVIAYPKEIANDILFRILYPSYHSNTYAVSILFGIFFMITYFLFFSLINLDVDDLKSLK